MLLVTNQRDLRVQNVHRRIRFPPESYPNQNFVPVFERVDLALPPRYSVSPGWVGGLMDA